MRPVGSLPKRVLITGAKGMLGADFGHALSAFGESIELAALGRDGLDVRDCIGVQSWARWIEGGLIIHCAAMVDVEGCAANPDAGRASIVEGARNIARLARTANAKVFYPQSFLVYGNVDGVIPENAEPAPLSRYGQFKLEAEKILRNETVDPLIVRMAGFFGGGSRDKNFVGRIIPQMHRAIETGLHEIKIGDRVWQPTYTRDLAANSVELLRHGKTGVYQMACRGEASFHELAQAIVTIMGWGQRLRVMRVSSAEVERDMSGSRPARAVLSCERLRSEGLDMQRPWQLALQDYLRAENAAFELPEARHVA